MSDQPAPPSPDLVHLITYLACVPSFRDPVLNIVATYLETIAEQQKTDVVDLMIKQEETVLGLVYRELTQCLLFHMGNGVPADEAEEKAVTWLCEQLATMAGVLPKDA